MNFTVNIDQFEGPLDLMLHLIKSNQLDLFDLDMNVLTTQYIDYITTLKHQNVEIASEYLSELASLIEYKSKKLLPKEVLEIDETYEENEKEKLVARLLEYQNYKEASISLQEAFMHRQELHSKPMSEETQNWMNASSEIISGSPYDLMKAMQRMIKRQILMKHEVGLLSVKEVSIEERSKVIQQFLKTQQGVFTFNDLCSDCTSVGMVVVSFLVLLDLMKNQKVFVEVKDDTILIQRKKYA